MRARLDREGFIIIYTNGARGALFVIALFIFNISLAHGLGLSISAGGVAASEVLSLGLPTSFEQVNSISGSGIMQAQSARGTGNNAIVQTVGGAGYSISSSLISSGSMVNTASAAACAGHAGATSNCLISGDAGYLSSSAVSSENSRYVAAGFSGAAGSMGAGLSSSAGAGAAIGGRMNVMGIDGLGDGPQGGSAAMTTSGLFTSSDSGVGEFGMISADIQGCNASSSVPGEISYQNDSRSYVLEGWRWEEGPGLKFYLSTDALFQDKSLNIDDTCAAIAGAAGTWDAATSQELFSGKVVPSSSKKTDRFDGKNVVGWRPIDSDVLAYAHTYYACNWQVCGADGTLYKRALESDISFNSKYSWVTSDEPGSYPGVPDTFDVETVALHEMGHAYGLGDLHDLKDDDPRRGDSFQIMNSYNDRQHELGAGDISGIQALYGR